MACDIIDVAAGSGFAVLLLNNKKINIVNYNENNSIPTINQNENNNIISISAGQKNIATIVSDATITSFSQIAGIFFSPRIISISNLPPGLKLSGNLGPIKENEIVYKQNEPVKIPLALTGLVPSQGPLFKKYKDIFSYGIGISGVFGSGDFNGYQSAAKDGNNLTGITAISLGYNHGLAILNKDKTITGWGDDTYSKASNGNNLTGAISISAGQDHNLALLANGRITGWGLNTSGQALSGNNLTGVIGIAVGQNHSLALLGNGKVTGWGDDLYQKTFGGNSLTGVIGIAAGQNHSLALLANGRVTGWGNNLYGQALSGNNLTGVIGISAGPNYNLALLANKKITGWGDNLYGKALSGNNLTGVSNISAGVYHGLALLDNGKVTGWGLNTNRQLSTLSSLTGVVSISAGYQTNLFLLKQSIITIASQGTEPLNITGNLTGFGITGNINGITGYTTQLVYVDKITGLNTGYEGLIYNITGKAILPGSYNTYIVIDELGNNSRYVERYINFLVPNNQRFPMLYKVCGGASLGFVDKKLT